MVFYNQVPVFDIISERLRSNHSSCVGMNVFYFGETRQKVIKKKKKVEKKDSFKRKMKKKLL